MAEYGKKAGEKVSKAMRERKRGKLKSGRSGKKVKSRKQAIAIGLSQARRAGAKVPPKKEVFRQKEKEVNGSFNPLLTSCPTVPGSRSETWSD
jgi:Family of unknown function (DUF6496)